MIQLATAGITDFIFIAAIVGIAIYGIGLYSDHRNGTAIKLRKDGSYSYERVPVSRHKVFPTWLKIAIFIVLASVLFIPLDFLLNRS